MEQLQAWNVVITFAIGEDGIKREAGLVKLLRFKEAKRLLINIAARQPFGGGDWQR